MAEKQEDGKRFTVVKRHSNSYKIFHIALLFIRQALIHKEAIKMEVERIFSAEQIKIHPELGQILREYTKSVIRANPDDLLEFSWAYFKKKVDEKERKNQRFDDKPVNFDDL